MGKMLTRFSKKAFDTSIERFFLFNPTTQYVKKTCFTLPMNKNLLPILGILLACALGSCAKKMKATDFELADKIAQGEHPLLTFQQVSTLYTEATKKVMKVEAPVQLRYENGDERFPQGLSMERYDPQQALMTTLVADSAFYNYEEDVYKVMGNVVVVNMEKKQQLETDELNWDRKTEEIHTERPVRITDEYQIINGKGLRANQDFSEYTLSEVTGSVAVRR